MRADLVPVSRREIVATKLYSYAVVSLACGVSRRTLERWVKRGCVPSPVYRWNTARFSGEAFRSILDGPSFPGTHPVAPSPRAEAAKRVAEARAKQRRPAKKRPTAAPDTVANKRRAKP